MEEKKMIEKICSANSAVVTAHVNPDGDTLGSMLALAQVLEQAGVKEVHRVMHDEVPEIYKFFPDQGKVFCSQKTEDLAQLKDKYDLSFSCDCGSIARLGSAAKIWQQAQTTCNVDHHLSNPLYGDLNRVDPDATCTGQVVKAIADDLIEQGKQIQINKDLASLYYITLLTDTGGFRHSNTNAQVFNWARELVDQGVEPDLIYNKLFNQIPFRAIKIIGSALNKLEFFSIESNAPGKSQINLAYTYTTQEEMQELKAKDEDTDEIVDHIMRIKDIDMCLYLREGSLSQSKHVKFKGSLRSACQELDCSQVATQLNGGGHARAAGFNPEAGNLDDLKNKVLELLKNYSSLA